MNEAGPEPERDQERELEALLELSRRGDVARERAAGQEIQDEVAADGSRHEQDGWPACARLARFVEQAQQA